MDFDESWRHTKARQGEPKGQEHMTILTQRLTILPMVVAVFFTTLVAVFAPDPAKADVTALKQAIAEAASRDKDIAAFYKAYGYKTLWTGRSGRERQRRAQLLRYLNDAGDHGLPVSR